MKFLKDDFVKSMILYAVSLAFFGGVGHLVIDSSEHILIKVFFIIGLLVLGLYFFNKLHEKG